MLWISHLPTASLFLLLLLCFPGQNGNASEVVEQSPPCVSPQEGQSVSITCALRSSDAEKEIYLLKTHMQHEKVLYVSSQNPPTISPAFANRLEYSKEEKKIVITLHNLWKNDSGIYVCVGVFNNSYSLSANRMGTMILVKDAEVKWTVCGNSLWAIYGLVIVVVLLFSALVWCTLYRVNIKKYFQKKKPNAVYEDMSYSSRRSTLVRTNTYSTDKSVPAGTEHGSTIPLQVSLRGALATQCSS